MSWIGSGRWRRGGHGWICGSVWGGALPGVCFAREELQSVQRELEVLSEQYSQKCLENAHLAQALEAERQALRQCQRENQELNAHNQVRGPPRARGSWRGQGAMGKLPDGQGGGLCVEPWPCSSFPQRLSSASQELNNRLAAEITRLRTLLTGEGGGEAAGSPLTQGKDAYELEVSSLPCQRGSVGGYKCLWLSQDRAVAIHSSAHGVCMAGRHRTSGPGALGVLISPSRHVKPDTHSSFSSPACPLGFSPPKAVKTNRN